MAIRRKAEDTGPHVHTPYATLHGNAHLIHVKMRPGVCSVADRAVPPLPFPPRLQHPFVQDYDGTEEMERLLETYLSLEVETVEEPVCSGVYCNKYSMVRRGEQDVGNRREFCLSLELPVVSGLFFSVVISTVLCRSEPAIAKGAFLLTKPDTELVAPDAWI